MSQLRNPAPDALSDRELEVLSLIAQGETNRGAAARLFISEATVKTHLLHIYAKLDVNDRAAAVATAFERGLLRTSRDQLTARRRGGRACQTELPPELVRPRIRLYPTTRMTAPITATTIVVMLMPVV